MLQSLIEKVFGSKNERDVRKLRPMLEHVNLLEAEVQALSDEELKARTGMLKEKLAQGATLEDILPHAFATVREASRRTLAMRHFDVQILGGIVLHQGRISEMKTGEGKTLVATLPVYLNALAGKGVHVVTVNDYLAKRDSGWMGTIYRFLGLSVGVIQHDLSDAERRVAYAADVTYGTNNEFGFDFLRDNMKFSMDEMVQRPHHYAIVDEVDSILIDEARTPLIISGPTDDATDKYYHCDRVIPQLKRDVHYQVDEKHRAASFTEDGIERIESILGVKNIYDPEHFDLIHLLTNALKAHTLFKRDVEYMVKDGEVVIVDEFTGRLMPGRRWSDGLHQAVEAKEKVKIERESQTYATITFQNYFRMYKKLAGMTGTAQTEAAEFHKIYNLDVTAVPTNQKMIRTDHEDVVYRTEAEKFNAITRQIAKLYVRGQPVLVGTISIEKSERLSELLGKMRAFFAPKPLYMSEVLIDAEIVPEDRQKDLEKLLDADRCRHIVEKPARLKELLRDLAVEPGETAARFMDVLDLGRVPHVVLNAKYHEKEAQIVAQAGRLGSVTIATNMAGRGTDILLGGNPDYMARQELGADLAGDPEIDDYKKYRETLEKYRESCKTEHDQVVALGGLFILGSERHESRRIDNQLRGRAGRQGDPGESRFYLSLQDDLMRIFGSDRVSGLMQRLGMEEDEPIISGMVSRSIERAQKQVEAQNFSIRKHLLEYDDVMNKQRQAFYKLRRGVLEGQSQREYLLDTATERIEVILDDNLPADKSPAGWDYDGVKAQMLEQFGIDLEDRMEELRAGNHGQIRDALVETMTKKYERKEAELEGMLPGLMRRWEQDIMLYVADNAWRDHLYALDHLKEGIGLRGYAQRDPLVEYKRESFDLFERMWTAIEEEILRRVFLFKPVIQQQPPPGAQPPAPGAVSSTGLPAGAVPRLPGPRPAPRRELQLSGAPSAMPAGGPRQKPAMPKVGRNDPCPCGSGKKYKKCHGTAE